VALEEANRDVVASYLLGLILMREGNRSVAMRRIKRVESVQGDFAPIIALSAELAARDGQMEQAQSSAQIAYRIDPESMRVRQVRYLARK
jgi:hypothetical protein